MAKQINLVGIRFGKLEVLEASNINGYKAWLCKCDCGNIATVITNQLKSGYKKSCGCIRHPNVIGQKFGRLTIIKYVGDNKRKTYLCLCDCGKQKEVKLHKLKYGSTASCGCLRNDVDRTYARKEFGVSHINTIFYNYKRNAQSKGLVFELDKKLLTELIGGNCIYCGTEPNNVHKKKGMYGEFYYNGIDRLNNNLGYVQGNVASCCKNCNYKKKDDNYEDFVSWINQVHENLNKNANTLYQ